MRPVATSTVATIVCHWYHHSRYGDSVDNTVENSSVFSLIRTRWLPSTLHQQNPPVLNWRCRLTQVDLYNGRKMGRWGWLIPPYRCSGRTEQEYSRVNGFGTVHYKELVTGRDAGGIWRVHMEPSKPWRTSLLQCLLIRQERRRSRDQLVINNLTDIVRREIHTRIANRFFSTSADLAGSSFERR